MVYIFPYLLLQLIYVLKCLFMEEESDLVTCRIFSWPGIEPVPPVVEGQSQKHWVTKDVP